MEKIKPHFQLSEFLHGCSDLERKCMPVQYHDNILKLALMLELLRQKFPYPIKINSCYRDKGHNARVGGTSTSQHLTASAVDFRIMFPPHCFDDIFIASQYIFENFEFGQCILYDSFIHLSLPRSNKPNQQFINKTSLPF